MAICGAFFASSAICCSFVETLSRVCGLVIFSSSKLHCPAPLMSLPSTGSLGLVPPLHRYYGELRLLVTRPACEALRFLRAAVLTWLGSSLPRDASPSREPGLDPRGVRPAFE